MPKLLDLKKLADLFDGAPRVADNPHYFLFMQGTDTVYTPRPTKNDKDPTKRKYYENGETLSYIAQVVAQQLNETAPEISADQPLAFSTPSVDVVIGPKTKGYEVGERVAQGVFLILKALAEGKTNIQISAHSRGAVETLLITHELKRIQTELEATPGKTLYSVLCNTSCTYTKKAIKQFFKEAGESSAVRQSIVSTLKRANTHLFLIDPVPGGRVYGIYPGWEDSRFCTKPPCTTAEMLLCRDERTACFTPLVPEGLKPLLIPGHHGTASGNRYSQCFEVVPDSVGPNKDTTLVQQLVVHKLLACINKSTGILDRGHSTVDLEHPELDKITNEFLRATPDQRLRQLQGLYKSVHLNDKAYRHFTTTTYPLLNSDEHSGTKSRYVTTPTGYSGLNSIVPTLDGEFVNTEQAFLYLHEVMEFSLETDMDILPLMARLRTTLQHLFEEYKGGDPKVKALLNDKKNRQSTFHALSHFIDSLSQRYLQNHLTVDVKTALLAEIDKMFELFISSKTLLSTDLINDIVSDGEQIVRRGVKNTAETHYQSLVDHSDKLNTQLKCFLATSEEFSFAFAQFITDLDASVSQETGEEDLAIIQRAVAAFKALSPVAVESARELFSQQIQVLMEHEGREEGRKAVDVILKCARGQIPNLISFFDNDNLNAQELLVQLNRVHENINSLINGKAHVERLASSAELSIDFDLLRLHKDRVLKYAALILAKGKTDLHVKPEYLSDEFFAVLKPQAIAVGCVDPAIDDLRKDLHILHIRTLEQKESIARLEDNIAQKDDAVETLKAAHLDQSDILARVQAQYEQKMRELAGLSALNEQQSATLIKLGSQYEQQSTALARIKGEDEQKAAGLLELRKDLQILHIRTLEQKESIARLEDSIAQKDDAVETLKAAHLEQSNMLARVQAQYEQKMKELAGLSALHEQQSIALTVLTTQYEQQSAALAELGVQYEQKSAELLELGRKYEQNSLALIELGAKYEQHTAALVELKAEYKRKIDDLSILSAKYKQQSDELFELGSKHKQQSAALAEINVAYEQKAAALTELNAQYEQKSSSLLEVNARYEQQSIALAELNVKQEQQSAALARITAQYKQQSTDMADLDTKYKQQSAILDELNAKYEQQTISHREQGALIRQLTQTNAEISSIARQAQEQLAEKEGTIEQLHRAKEEQKQLIQQLLTSKELACAQLIEEKLVPLTEDYLKHLALEAQKINASISADAVHDELLALDDTYSQSDQFAYGRIIAKYNAVQKLLAGLDDKENVALPSNRVIQFTTSLKSVHDELKQHRSSQWSCYFKNCMVAISVICSGIIPGIIALFAYSSFNQKSSPLFFANTHGEEYHNTVQASITNSGLVAAQPLN